MSNTVSGDASMLKPLPGFQSLATHHCISGSLQQVYAFHGSDISEELLFGLGSGLGFVYWHMKGTDPFFGGRANVGRASEEGLEITAGRRTGVAVQSFTTSSSSKAEKALLELLEGGEPVYLFVDMGFLPYLDLPEGYHFGAHAVVAAGCDPAAGVVLIADRDTELHTVTIEALRQARGSKYQPFPPQHKWFVFDFSGLRAPKPTEVRQAIKDVAEGMVHPPIANLGVKGIVTAGKRARQWTKIMTDKEARWSCFNVFIFIDATGGTGGGIFRYMYSRFLQEAAAICADDRLDKAGGELQEVGDLWQEVAVRFKRASKAPNLQDAIIQATEPLPAIAERESKVWSELLSVVG